MNPGSEDGQLCVITKMRERLLKLSPGRLLEKPPPPRPLQALPQSSRKHGVPAAKDGPNPQGNPQCTQPTCTKPPTMPQA